MFDIKEYYKENYNEYPESIFDCGGRFEILGNHTDHNHGKCLAATSDLCITAGISKRNDLIVNMVSFGFESFKVDLNKLDPIIGESKSGAMVRGIAKYLTDKGYKIGGFNAALYSTIYSGAGLSSSAAFELLIAEIFNVLFNNSRIDRLLLCKAGQFSENFYFGKKSGLLDQIGVGFGNIVEIDFENIVQPKVAQVKFPFKNLHFVTVNTGGDHSNLNALYSSIPEDMYNAAKKLGHQFLRECNYDDLTTNDALTEMEKNRAIHFFTENIRVESAIKALKEYDEKAFLKAVNESRISSTNYLKNMMVENHYEGSPLQATDRGMEIMEGNGACKINGGGFAGSIIALVPSNYLDIFLKKMKNYYGDDNVKEIFVRECGPQKVC